MIEILGWALVGGLLAFGLGGWLLGALFAGGGPKDPPEWSSRAAKERLDEWKRTVGGKR